MVTFNNSYNYHLNSKQLRQALLERSSIKCDITQILQIIRDHYEIEYKNNNGIDWTEFWRLRKEQPKPYNFQLALLFYVWQYHPDALPVVIVNQQVWILFGNEQFSKAKVTDY